MKKSLILVGLLSIGYAHAQYEEKVGINTEQPSATLNVKSKTGTTKDTKNFELENADGTKMVTVLDDGKVGIGTETPKQKLQVVGLANFSDSEVYTGDNYGLSVRNSTGRIAEFYYRDYNTKTFPRLNIKGDKNKININTSFSSGGANLGIGTLSNPDLIFLREYENKKNLNYVGIGTNLPENKLHIKADVDPLKLEGLQPAGANAQNLVVEDGVVKIGAATASTGATQVGTGENSMPCNDANRGKMNFQRDITLSGGGTADAFAVCLKGSDGQHYWRYLYGGAGVSNLTGNFGENLPK